MANSNSFDATQEQLAEYVRAYLNKGHAGFILWYQRTQDPEGPSAQLLDKVSERVAKSRFGRLSRYYRALAEAIS